MSSRAYLKYSRMLVACGIGLQKLCCIIGAWSIHSCGSALSGFSRVREEVGASTKGFVVVGVVSGLCRWQH